MKTKSSILEWLDHFASCVRKRDIEQGKALFAPEVQAFGTRTEQALDLAELTEHQWAPIWHNTRQFRFLHDTVTTMAANDGSLVCVLALWSSRGVGPDGKEFPRRGRCTILLKRDDSTARGYVAVHTHFSKTPSGEV